MAFWGVQVKPGRPYTHAPGNNARGRLHVSQATLGAGTVENGVVFLQCNVGDKSPVYLCALSWDKVISCPVNAEFEEDEDVVFSVVGPRSVHLSGYYSRPSGDPEPPGEDLADSEAEQSVEGSEGDDEYEDSFIDDGDPEDFSPSAVSSDEEYSMEAVKTKNRKGTRKRLKKKHQISESNDSGSQQTFVHRGARAILSESDSDDNCPISSLVKTELSENGIRSYDDKAADKRLSDTTKAVLKDDSNSVDSVDVQDDRDIEQSAKASWENGTKLDLKTKQVSKEEKPLASEGEYGTELELKTKQVPKDEKPMASEGEHGPELNCAKTLHGATVTKKLDLNPSVNEEEQSNPNDKGDNLPEVELPPNCQVSDDVPLSKKKRKKSDSKSQHGEAKAKSEVTHDVLQSGETKKAIGNGILHGNPEHYAEANSSEKKKKKKRRKIQETVDENKTSTATKEHSSAAKESSQLRTLSNGLLIKDVEMGKPDGEVAVFGKKVTICYSGKVKEEGQQLDLSTDGETLKFRLGKEKVIKGLDVGIEGMRVGDWRRLIIPPSLGYGSEGNGDNVPPDAWLVYEVKLIKVQ